MAAKKDDELVEVRVQLPRHLRTMLSIEAARQQIPRQQLICRLITVGIRHQRRPRTQAVLPRSDSE